MKFDGKEVTTMRGLPKIVAQTQIGKTVDVEVLRKGATKTLQIKVGLLQDEIAGESKPEDEESDTPQGAPPVVSEVIGLKLVPLTDEIRRKYGLDEKVTGAVIDDIDPDSPAAQKGLKPGDVVVEAGQNPVSNPDDVVKSVDKVKKSGRKAVLLRVEDGKGDLRFVAVPLDAKPE
jgi:serine protease Do